tara:strand:- start:1469 stop:2326 length:858 start_codon:yes stop_codon:yes gene_type:complete
MKFLCGYNFSKECDYIFSRGEPKTAGGKPIVLPTGEYDVFCREDLLGLKDGDLVFCKIDNLPKLSHLLKKTNKTIYLITHDSDYEINEEVFTRYSNNIKHWWGVNVNYIHPNLSSIPLGLGSPWVPGGVTPQSLTELESPLTRDTLLYINHRIETYPQDRKEPYDYFANKSWATIKHPSLVGQTFDYIQEVRSHKFVLCPRGNGIDTYRFWESLYLGAIPIVKDCINISFYKELPITIINEYSDITKELLEPEYERHTPLSWEGSQLDLNYWMTTIREKINEYNN